MRLKIRCDGECEKFYKIFWELNTALVLLAERKRFLLGVFVLEPYPPSNNPSIRVP
jgi:hypothetical protein